MTNTIAKKGILYVVHNEWISDPATRKFPYKIGIASISVESRYYGLGLKMPGEFICDFAYELDDYSKIETFIHGLLHLQCVGGEWFNVDDKVLTSLKSLCEQMNGRLITKEISEEIIEQEELSGRIKKLTFYAPVDSELVFTKDNTKRCTIKNDKKVDYMGKEFSLSGLANELLKPYGLKNKVAGALYFTYNGKLLKDIQKENT
jgi:hypothetical protein